MIETIYVDDNDGFHTTTETLQEAQMDKENKRKAEDSLTESEGKTINKGNCEEKIEDPFIVSILEAMSTLAKNVIG